MGIKIEQKEVEIKASNDLFENLFEVAVHTILYLRGAYAKEDFEIHEFDTIEFMKLKPLTYLGFINEFIETSRNRFLCKKGCSFSLIIKSAKSGNVLDTWEINFKQENEEEIGLTKPSSKTKFSELYYLNTIQSILHKTSGLEEIKEEIVFDLDFDTMYSEEETDSKDWFNNSTNLSDLQKMFQAAATLRKRYMTNVGEAECSPRKKIELGLSASLSKLETAHYFHY
ncbi:hypothetical protein K502DRAFT_341315 [Neoconidiobolus thromboides FSU 785]|nr:hypothetical protein K502DRAFT_341315 [Neoconidiobolus thromboides FSU 785]